MTPASRELGVQFADESIGKPLTDEHHSDLVARLAALPRTNQFRAVTLTSDLDPRRLLADPVASGVSASYERPDRGLALVGVGVARRIEVPEGRGPAAVREDVRHLFETPVEGDAPGLRPRLLGGFRFNLVEFDQTVTRLREQLRKLEMETEAQILSRYQREMEHLPGDPEFDPLELDRFSTLQQLSRALAESVSDLMSLQNLMDDIARQSETLLLQQSRVSSDLQEGLMRTRMVPFESLVPRLRRIMRQTTGELGKRAQLKVEGAQGEMDRTVLERMTAPMEHMLRNALAHGLESRGDRGQPPTSNIQRSTLTSNLNPPT